jgi:signal transduction histidine kinase
MNAEQVHRRYQQLQAYVGWAPEDARRVAGLADLLTPHFPALIDDFYAEIERHPNAARVITGGPDQIQRLKLTLTGWLRELVSGTYDADYVARRWRVGWRHVEIGLEQVFTNVALSRLRSGLCRAVLTDWPAGQEGLQESLRALNSLLDLDLALIEDAYQAEHVARQQRSERLAAIGQVAGGVAHELRNPLNVVRTSVYFLLNARAPSPEKTAEHLKRIERHVTLADNVISALSSFAKMPVPAQAPFSVAACLREVLEIDAPPARCRVTWDFPDGVPAALADVNQVRIVFANLVRNAFEAMPQGGELTLTGRADGDRVDVTVRDTGVGIAPEVLARILEPLYSTKARGLGLGLAIARAILEKNQGELRVQSHLGQGSTFTVRLPRARGKEESAP